MAKVKKSLTKKVALKKSGPAKKKISRKKKATPKQTNSRKKLKTYRFVYILGSLYTKKSENKKFEEFIEYNTKSPEDAIALAAQNWDFDDSSCLNYKAKSRLVETYRDLIKIVEVKDGNEIVLNKEYLQLYADKEDEARGF